MNRFTLLLFLSSITLCSAERIYVDADAAPGGDGTSWATAFNYLQDALYLAATGINDEIWIASGTYYPDDGINVTEGDREASFTIGVQELALYGGFSGGETSFNERDWELNPTILSGEINPETAYWSLHVVTVSGPMTKLDGLIIEKGNANGVTLNTTTGGGLITDNVYASLLNCTIRENYAAYGGGGIWGTIVATDCSFLDNSAIQIGGAIYSGNAKLTGCSFINNSAESGGAIQGYLDAHGCVFENNFADRNGGAVYGNRYCRIADCIFIGNRAGTEDIEGSNHIGIGGALMCGDNTTIVSCIFRDNWSINRGGAIHGDWLEIVDSFFIHNQTNTGGAVYGSITAMGTTFLENSGELQAGAIQGEAYLSYCSLVGNTSGGEAGAIYGRTELYCSILWDNFGTDGMSIVGDVQNYHEDFPSPTQSRAVNLIEGGSTFISGATDFGDESTYLLIDNPLFKDIGDPLGPDDSPGTADDGIRLGSGSPAIGKGDFEFLPLDEHDLDNDGIEDEYLPLDIAGYRRLQNDSLDLGAYEYGDSKTFIYILSVTGNTGGTVSPDEEEQHEEGAVVNITATPNAGYIFGSWSGDFSSTDNPATLPVTDNLSISANFLPDTEDPDGDNLTNYEEAVIYGTETDNPDTDSDGIRDGDEVAGLLNPLVDNSATIEMLLSHPEYLPGVYTSEAYAANYEAGIDHVTNNPSLYDLYTAEDYNANYETGISHVVEDPLLYDLYRLDQIQMVDLDGFAAGMDEDGKLQIRIGIRVSEDLATWAMWPIQSGDISVIDGDIILDVSPVDQTGKFFKAAGSNR